jgi:hypothetical protein
VHAATTGYGNDNTRSVRPRAGLEHVEQPDRIGLEDAQIEPAREHARASGQQHGCAVSVRAIEAGGQRLQHRHAHHVGLAVVHRQRGDAVGE